jgi:hypothetical protein
LSSNVPPDFSRSPLENDGPIHKFAEAIIFDPTLGSQIYSRLAVALCFPIPIIPDEALLLLRPVTLPYKTKSKDAPQVGVIAE